MRIHLDHGNNAAACRDRNAHSRKYVLTTNPTEVTCKSCQKSWDFEKATVGAAVRRTWTNGDRVYATVSGDIYPAHVAHLYENGREWPVAIVRPSVNADNTLRYTLVRWVDQKEAF